MAKVIEKGEIKIFPGTIQSNGVFEWAIAGGVSDNCALAEVFAEEVLSPPESRYCAGTELEWQGAADWKLRVDKEGNRVLEVNIHGVFKGKCSYVDKMGKKHSKNIILPWDFKDSVDCPPLGV